MLQWHAKSRVVYPPAPDGWTMYVIGDIHGRLDLLEGLQQSIDIDKRRVATSKTIEIYLGDYIDRGPQSNSVLTTLIKRATRTHAVFLRGNHEQLLLDFLGGRNLLNQWKTVGAVPTLLSYGLPAGLLAGDTREERVRDGLRQRFPPEHLDFLARTGSYCDMEPYLMVHAGVRPGIRLEDQRLDDLLGIRNDFLDYNGDLGSVVVHGHTPVREPDFRANRINIDTGAFATNRLTCLKIGEHGPSVLDPAPPP